MPLPHYGGQNQLPEVIRESASRLHHVGVPPRIQERFPESKQFLRNLLPKPIQGIFQPQWSMILDGVVDAVDLGFEITEPFN